MLSACGSDSEVAALVKDVTENLTPDGTPDALTTEYSCELAVGSSVMKLGATGAFSVECTDDKQRLVFTDEIQELAIVNVVATHSGQFTEEGIVVNFEETVDYAKGTAHRKGSHSSEGSFDCTLTYDVGDMPQTIYQAYEIESFFWLDEDDNQLLSSTCPSWMDDDDDDNDDDVEGSGESEESTNAVITDAQGSESTISMYFKGNWDDFDDDNDN